MEDLKLNEDKIHPVIEQQLLKPIKERIIKEESSNYYLNKYYKDKLIGKKQRRSGICLDNELIKRKMNGTYSHYLTYLSTILEKISNDIDSLLK